MTSGKYTVQFVPSSAEISSELWDRCFPPPLEGRWWYETLEQSHLEDQFDFLYAIILDEGNPAGIAPLFLMDVPIELVLPPEFVPVFKFAGRVFPSVKYQRTLFVGSPCADEGSVGFLPGVDRRAALLCLARALDEKAKSLKAPMLVWKDFSAAHAGDLDWLAGERNLFRIVSFPGAVIDLPSGTKDGYYAAMKASRRQKIKRKLRLSCAAADLTVEVIQKPASSRLDEIFALFGQTFEKATTKFERLNRAFFSVIAEKTAAYFVVVREKQTKRMVAFMLCFAVGDRLINKFIGIDYSRPKDWALYFRLWDAALDWALAQGFTSIQSGQTGYSAKIELGNELVPLTNYCRHRNRLIHAVYGFVAKTIGWHTLDAGLAAHLKAHPEAYPQALATQTADRARRLGAASRMRRNLERWAFGPGS
jgi:hypothetical protein